MSANWYTFKCYCKDADTANKLHQALLPFEEENVGSVVRRLNSLNPKTKLTEKELDDLYPEYLNLSDGYVECQLQGGTSSMLSKSMAKALANGGASILVIDIFYDQVGESEEFYFKNGKSVDYEDIEDELVALDPSHEIEQAIDDDDEEKALELLANGMDPNQLVDETPLLTRAIDYEMFNLALALLEAGAEIPEDEVAQEELINSAVNTTNVSLISSLLEKGLDFASTDYSPYLSIDYKHRNAAKVTRLFIENNLDVTIVDESGSVLWQMSPPVDIARIMKEAGAQLIAPDNAYTGEYGDDLKTAIAHQHAEKLKELWDEDKIKLLNRVGLIETCLEYDRAKILSSLLGRSIKPFEVMTFEGAGEDLSLIQYAIRNQSADCLTLMVEHIPEQLKQEQQDIIIDCYTNNCHSDTSQKITDTLEKLLSSLPIHSRLLIAIQKDDINSLKKLAPQATLSKPSGENNKPLLHHALEWDAKQCLSYLLEQSAPLEEKNFEGNSTFGLAIRQGQTDMISLLIKAGSDPNTIVCPDREEQAEAAAEQKLAEFFFSAAAGSNSKGKKTMAGVMGLMNSMQDKYGSLEPAGKAPAILVAAYYGDSQIIAQLLETNIELNQVDEKGRTALMMAIADENDSVVEQLLKAGADTRIEDSDGKSAMSFAKSRDKSLVKLLKKYSKKKKLFKIF